jgi:hypothetical protein
LEILHSRFLQTCWEERLGGSSIFALFHTLNTIPFYTKLQADFHFGSAKYH